jgi:dTDP-glucose 4,6-dehydratase
MSNSGWGAELVGLTRNPESFLAKSPHLADHESITLHRWDIRDFQFPEGTFTHFIHGGVTPGASIAPDEMLDTIIHGTKRTLAFGVASGAKRFLFVSSGAVYGKQPPDITNISETYQGYLIPSSENARRGGELGDR